eukprot:Protomagalhaensia_wolfi_Nauph_80__1141@NODE_1671_length_1406_cov_45_210680_g1296_i0_p1_GENE_NODE_1671_length_1406_cov_45_210680_g1296_i0NODE_1671_length_1406_cov_45_210680_g1296_i0_p1_ORF_typecomplete_len367_score23_93Cnd1/PF12717_7/0_073_NODE_1671_length_1406_cov_45_210680_g1296_i0461146
MTEDNIDMYLEKLTATNDTGEALEIIRFIALRIQSRPGTLWTLTFAKALELLSYLERISVNRTDDDESILLIRETVSLMARFGRNTGLDSEPLPRPVYSSLMAESSDDDPFLLEVLCDFIRHVTVRAQSSKPGTVEDFKCTLKATLSEDVTVLDRLLQLLDHPSWPLSSNAINCLAHVVKKDKQRQFSVVICERLSRNSRDLLRAPNLGTRYSPYKEQGRELSSCRYSLFDLLILVVDQYPLFINLSIDCGLVEDLVLLVEASFEAPSHSGLGVGLRHTARLRLLWLLVTRSNDDQVNRPQRNMNFHLANKQKRKLAGMGCFPASQICTKNHPEISVVGFLGLIREGLWRGSHVERSLVYSRQDPD